MSEDRAGYMSAEEASSRLGVKRATLYSYVSRGLIRSEEGEGRERLYLRADVERVRVRAAARAGHGAVAAGALRWGEPVLDTAISAVGPEGPRYRGRLALELASSGVGFEEVARWLWTGEEGVAPGGRWCASGVGGLAARVAVGLRPGATALEGMALGVALLGAGDGGRYVQTVEAEVERAQGLILRMAALAALPEGRVEGVEASLRGGTVAEVLACALGGRGEGVAGVVERCMILCADHELNASSFTARVVASTGADLYACVGAALGALSGPRHGGMTYRVEALCAEAQGRLDPAEAALERLRRGESLPGFGHRLYPAGDPRTPPLLAWAREHGRGRGEVEALLRIVDVLGGSGYAAPTVDLGLVAVASALGLGPGAAAVIFAVGRAAGWVAHVLEQRAQGTLLRPTARYTGPG